MPEVNLPIKIDASGRAVIGETATAMEDLGNKAARSADGMQVFTDKQQRAQQGMMSLHEQAIALNRDFDKSYDSAHHFSEGLESLAQHIEGGVGGALSSTAGLLGGFGAAALAAGAEAVHLANAFGEWGNKLENLHIVTGLSASALATWDESAKVTGVSAESMAMAMERLSAGIGSGNAKVLDGLALLKIDLDTFTNASPEERIRMLSDAFAKVGVDTDTAHAAAKDFGKSFLTMLPAMTEEAQRYRAQIEGITGNVDASAKSAKAYAEQTGLMGVQWEHFLHTVGEGVATSGAITQLTGAIGALNDLFTRGTPLAESYFGKMVRGAADNQSLTRPWWSSPPTEAGLPSAPPPPKGPYGPPSKPYVEDAVAPSPEAMEAYNRHLKEAADLIREQAREDAAWEKATQAVTGAIVKMDEAGGKAYATLDKFAAYQAAINEGLGKSYAEFSQKQSGVDAEVDASLSRLEESYNKAKATAEENGVSTTELTADYKKNQQAIIDSGDATKAMNEGAFRPMITVRDADTAATKSGVEVARLYCQELKNEAAAAGAFSEKLGQNIEALGSLAGALGAGDGVTGALGGFGKALGSYGKFQEAFFTGDVIGMATSAVSTVKNLVGVVKSLFGKSEAEKIGDDFGGAISDGLAKAIEDTENKDHVSRALAEVLHASEIFGETGNVNPIFDELSAVALGAVDAKEGIDDLGKAFSDLQTAADGGSITSEAAMIKMIQRSRELGLSIPALDAAVKALSADAMKELEGFYGGQHKGAGGAQQGIANNAIFDAVWAANVGTQGIVAATEAMKKDLDALIATGTPLTGSAAEAAHIEHLLLNKDFAGAASGAAAGGKITKDLLDSGQMSQKTLDAMDISAKTFYDQAIAGGGSQLDAEEAALPLLTQLQHAQELGLKLSPDMQAMLSKAQADGILPAVSLAEQQLDVLKQIRDGGHGAAPPTNPGGSGGSGGGGDGSSGGSGGGGGGGGTHGHGGTGEAPDHPTGPPPGSGAQTHAFHPTSSSRAGGSHVSVTHTTHVHINAGNANARELGPIVDKVIKDNEAGTATRILRLVNGKS